MHGSEWHSGDLRPDSSTAQSLFRSRLDSKLREGADESLRSCSLISNGSSAVVLLSIARALSTRACGIAGCSLGLTPAVGRMQLPGSAAVILDVSHRRFGRRR
jgi:hypothetical protein